MHRGSATLCALLLLGGCEKEPSVAPEGIELVTAASGKAAGISSATLTATALAPTLIALTWQDNSTNETGFEIHRSTTGPAGPFALHAVAPANATSATDASVPPSRVSCYRIRAFRSVGRKTTFGPLSNIACARTPALPPSGVSAIPQSSSTIDVAWRDNDASTDDTFRIERSPASGGPWESIATTPPSQTSYIDAGRASDQQVCYRVVASSSEGDSEPSNVDCTSPPRGPTSLTATADASGISLAWQDNSAVEDGYWIERSDDGVTFISMAALSANSTAFQDAAISINTAYWYRVRARKEGGSSDASNVASAMRTCAPTDPNENACDDGIDNDCDDLIDSYDPDCGVSRCDFDFCAPGFVCTPEGFCVSHCGDGGWNGDEGDVDCGGSCDTKCQADQHCWGHFDCASGVCINDVCQPSGGAQ